MDETKFSWEEGDTRSVRVTGHGMKCARTRKETHPTGVKVSMPLAAAQGRPLDFATSWTFLAVISTARADKGEKMWMVSEVGMRTDRSRRCDSVHPLGRYRDQAFRLPGRVRLRVIFFVNWGENGEGG